jgi:hypothetical protein
MSYVHSRIIELYEDGKPALARDERVTLEPQWQWYFEYLAWLFESERPDLSCSLSSIGSGVAVKAGALYDIVEDIWDGRDAHTMLLIVGVYLA